MFRKFATEVGKAAYQDVGGAVLFGNKNTISYKAYEGYKHSHTPPVRQFSAYSQPRFQMPQQQQHDLGSR